MKTLVEADEPVTSCQEPSVLWVSRAPEPSALRSAIPSDRGLWLDDAADFDAFVLRREGD